MEKHNTGLYDKDGNEISPQEATTFLQKVLDHPMTKELTDLNKQCAMHTAQAQLGTVIMSMLKDKMFYAALPDAYAKAIEKNPIMNALVSLLIANAGAGVLAFLSQYLPEGPMQKICKVGGNSLVAGAWDGSITPAQVSSFLGTLLSADVVKLAAQIDPTIKV